jgi:hypothetical protein
MGIGMVITDTKGSGFIKQKRLLSDEQPLSF